MDNGEWSTTAGATPLMAVVFAVGVLVSELKTSLEYHANTCLVYNDTLQAWGEGATIDEAITEFKNMVMEAFGDMERNEYQLGQGMRDLLALYRGHGITADSAPDVVIADFNGEGGVW